VEYRGEQASIIGMDKLGRMTIPTDGGKIKWVPLMELAEEIGQAALSRAETELDLALTEFEKEAER
jgi:hypothetical protein